MHVTALDCRASLAMTIPSDRITLYTLFSTISEPFGVSTSLEIALIGAADHEISDLAHILHRETDALAAQP